MNTVIRKFDLVLTSDGYHGIVSSVAERYVFLSNGLEQQLSAEEWMGLKQLPLNTNSPDGERANFIGIERSPLMKPE